jgi:hypothetical protein
MPNFEFLGLWPDHGHEPLRLKIVILEIFYQYYEISEHKSTIMPFIENMGL